MFAAPSAPEQLHILADIVRLNWKERLQQYEALVNSLPEQGLDQLLEVEVCFLEMLKEKNLNVAVKVIELVRCYTRFQPITKVAVDELVLALFNFSGVATVQLETLMSEMYTRNDRKLMLEALGQCCRSKNTRKSLKGYRSLRILVETFGTEQMFWLQCNLEDVRIMFQSTNPQLLEESKQLMLALYRRIGSKAIQLATQFGCQYLQELQQFAIGHIQVLPFETFPEAALHKRFDFLSKYCSHLTSNLDQLKIKSLNDCLREMLEDSERNGFTEGNYQQLLTMLVGCAKRSNRTSNRLILAIVVNLAGKVDLQDYSEQLLDLLFELAGSEKLRKLLQNSPLLCIIKYEEYMQKITRLTTQTDYHKAIVLLALLKPFLDEPQKLEIREWFSHIKLNIVYRLELEALLTD